jgi:class 3 adenylate cyclase
LKGEDIEGVQELSWMNHGPYLLKGIEGPVEVCEVGDLWTGGTVSQIGRRCQWSPEKGA